MLNNLSQLAQQAVDEFRKATADGAGYNAMNPLQKSVGITVSTGIQNYDLQRPAKNLIPVLTPIRNRLPRVPGNGGPATNWIQVTGINTKNLRGPVPEGTRQGVTTTAAGPKSANYVTLGQEDFVTLQAELQAVNFEDIRATTGMRLLWATMIDEEKQIVSANYSNNLDMSALTPTLTVIATGGHVQDNGTGYTIRVVALTGLGLDASAVDINGVPDLVTVTPADGSASFTYGGGSSKVSIVSSGTGAISNSNVSILTAHVTAMPGAAGYAWYVGVTGGAQYLQAITTINSVSISAALVTNTQAVSSLSGSDQSKNLYGWDGLLEAALASGSGAYVKGLATGTDGVGTGLSAADPDGVIPEIDAMNLSHWNNYRLGADTIYVNAQEGRNISKKVLAANPMHINYLGGQSDGTGGQIIKRLLNPYTSTMQELVIHPYMSPGTLLAVTHTLPYPMSNVPNTIEMKLRRDYFQMEWPMRTLKYESGVYFDGVLATYFPPSLGVIYNIGKA